MQKHAETSPQAAGFQRLLVVGITGSGGESLSPALAGRINSADLLAGGQRHLSYFSSFKGEKLVISGEIEPVIQRLQQAFAAGQQAVVLASGDPLWYGIGATLRRYFPAEALEIWPAPTAFQLAFAALAEPWTDAALLSAHSRPLPAVVSGVLAAPKAAILTDNRHTPLVVAQALLAAGLSPTVPCAICENLGSAAQRIVKTTLGRVGEESYASLNVLVVWNQAGGQGSEGAEENISLFSPCSPAPLRPYSPGLPDDLFATSAGQITKREIRLLALAELALQPGQVLWDIGSGSGSISIEAARAQPAALIYAVEKRSEMYNHFQENLRRFPAPNIHSVLGMAPDATFDWPDPHAVFIGGSGQKLAEIVQAAQQRLLPGGRLVINLVSLENLQSVRTCLFDAHVTQVQINRGLPILDMLRFEALNPIFMVTWRKKGEEK
jgi:precorrin-6B C5,15-methyltransferase / cobalt-precorrin-6B C5,C15-methyltransferase